MREILCEVFTTTINLSAYSTVTSEKLLRIIKK